MPWPCPGYLPEEVGDNSVARTHRDIAIEEMLGTVEVAMSQVTDWWGDLPPPMKEELSSFVPNSCQQLML
jgi:hypothetical protein